MSKDTPDNVSTEFRNYKQEIDKALKQVFADLPKFIKLDLSSNSLAALEKLKEYSLRPGKRIRGSLATFAYDCATKSTYASAGLRAAVAIELIQSYLLVIDDVMDRSSLRRGLPTIHKLYLQEKHPQHLADMMALNVGLVSQHLASGLLASIDEEPTRLIKAGEVFHRNILATTFGQMDDLFQHSRVDNISETDILRMYRLKSSYYTFINPLQIGLILGGSGDEKILQEIEKFGGEAGIAFQLYDDLLGVYGQSAATGKSNLDDIKEGKYTLLIWYAFSHSSPEDLRLLKEALGNSQVDLADLAHVQQILEKCGSKKFVESRALSHAKQAKKIISASDFWDNQAKDFLIKLVDYSTKRER